MTEGDNDSLLNAVFASVPLPPVQAGASTAPQRAPAPKPPEEPKHEEHVTTNGHTNGFHHDAVDDDVHSQKSSHLNGVNGFHKVEEHHSEHHDDFHEEHIEDRHSIRTASVISAKSAASAASTQRSQPVVRAQPLRRDSTLSDETLTDNDDDFSHAEYHPAAVEAAAARLYDTPHDDHEDDHDDEANEDEETEIAVPQRSEQHDTLIDELRVRQQVLDRHYEEDEHSGVNGHNDDHIEEKTISDNVSMDYRRDDIESSDEDTGVRPLRQKTFHFDSDELDRVHEEPPTEAHDRTSLTDSIQNYDAVVVKEDTTWQRREIDDSDFRSESGHANVDALKTQFTHSHLDSFEINHDPYIHRDSIVHEDSHQDILDDHDDRDNFYRKKEIETHRAPSYTESERSFAPFTTSPTKPQVRDFYKPVVAVTPVTPPAPAPKAAEPAPPPVIEKEVEKYEPVYTEPEATVIHKSEPVIVVSPVVEHSEVREVFIRTAHSPVEVVKPFDEDEKAREKEELSAAPGVRNLRSLFESGAVAKRNFVVEKRVEETPVLDEIYRVPTPESIHQEPIYTQQPTKRDSIASTRTNLSVKSHATSVSTLKAPSHRDSVSYKEEVQAPVPVPVVRRVSNVSNASVRSNITVTTVRTQASSVARAPEPVPEPRHEEQHYYDEPVHHEPSVQHEEHHEHGEGGAVEESQRPVNELLSRFGGGIRLKPVITRPPPEEQHTPTEELYKIHKRAASIHSIHEVQQEEPVIFHEEQVVVEEIVQEVVEQPKPKSRTTTLTSVHSRSLSSLPVLHEDTPLETEPAPPTPRLSRPQSRASLYSPAAYGQTNEDQFQSVRVVKNVRQFVKVWGQPNYVPPTSPVIAAPRIADPGSRRESVASVASSHHTQVSNVSKQSQQSQQSQVSHQSHHTEQPPASALQSKRSSVVSVRSEVSVASHHSVASHRSVASQRSVLSAASETTLVSASKRSSIASEAPTLTEERPQQLLLEVEEEHPAAPPRSPAFVEHEETEVKIRGETVVLGDLVPVSQLRSLFEKPGVATQRNFVVQRGAPQPVN